MNGTLSASDAAAICEHMNDDHADALAAYARHYGRLTGVHAAKIVSLDARRMELDVRKDEISVALEIPFDHVLVDTNDARDTLIAMARHAITSS